MPGSSVPPTIVVAAEEGIVAGIHTENGKIRWRFRLETSPYAIAHSGDIVYISTHTQPTGLVRALHIQDGKDIWQTTNLPLAGRIMLALDGQMLIVDGNRREGINYALDAHTGAIIWQAQSQDQTRSQLITARAGKVYFSEQTGLSVRETQTGQMLWRFSEDVYFITPSEDGAFLAAHASTRDENRLLIFDANDGTIVANLPVDLNSRIIKLAGDIAYMLAYDEENPQIYALRVGDGAKLWQTGDEATPGSHPIVDGTNSAWQATHSIMRMCWRADTRRR
jgi:outer membrane protein assembly factor BamB